MDGQRFDALTKALAESGVSRRQALKLALTGGAAGVLALIRTGEADAARCLSPNVRCKGRGGGCKDLLTDPDHCGGCRQACSATNMATVTCNDGVCDGQCAAGFADCNGDKLGDGCETNTLTDPNHCGACNQPVGPGQACCNGVATDLTSDAANCGSCGSACAAGQICASGTCVTGQGICPDGGNQCGPVDDRPGSCGTACYCVQHEGTTRCAHFAGASTCNCSSDADCASRGPGAICVPAGTCGACVSTSNTGFCWVPCSSPA